MRVTVSLPAGLKVSWLRSWGDLPCLHARVIHATVLLSEAWAGWLFFW